MTFLTHWFVHWSQSTKHFSWSKSKTEIWECKWTYLLRPRIWAPSHRDKTKSKRVFCFASFHVYTIRYPHINTCWDATVCIWTVLFWFHFEMACTLLECAKSTNKTDILIWNRIHCFWLVLEPVHSNLICPSTG